MPEDDMREPNGRPNWLNPAVITAAIAIASIIYSAGTTGRDVTNNANRITVLEASDRTRTDAISRIDSRTARIEATLDVVTGREKFRPLSESPPHGDGQ